MWKTYLSEKVELVHIERKGYSGSVVIDHKEVDVIQVSFKSCSFFPTF